MRLRQARQSEAAALEIGREILCWGLAQFLYPDVSHHGSAPSEFPSTETAENKLSLCYYVSFFCDLFATSDETAPCRFAFLEGATGAQRNFTDA
jgi:hypothetical protein